MAIFPTHHGLLHLLSLPAPHTLAPPSDRLSTLRGLSSAGATSSPGGGGENNLAFRCTRKRLVFETLHLDLEGGVGERRTKPSTNAIALEEAGGTAHTALSVADPAALKADRPTVEVALEGVTEEGRLREMPSKAKKPKKQVAFRSDRPELYDF
jgi:elongator complex protein 4